MDNRRLVGAGPSGSPISHSGWRLLATGFALLLPVAALSATEQARADALPSNCAASGATVTCTYNSGSEGTFTVPVAVSSIHVVATGAGGHTTFAGPGGPGRCAKGAERSRFQLSEHVNEVDAGRFWLP